MGQLARQRKRFDVIGQKVKLAQKVVKQTPLAHVRDAFISSSTGATGLVEVNQRVRRAPLRPLAFGRTRCAQPSTIRETINAATQANVVQLNDRLKTSDQPQLHGFRHDDDQRLQLVERALSGMPCGKKAELASKGSFAKPKNQRGRQVGRVIASLVVLKG